MRSRCNTNLTKIILSALTLSLVAFASTTNAQNSTRKIRVKPGELSSKIGSGVDWVDDLQEGMKLARETNKLVFWYVPTLRNSFMDRVDSIDRYMLAGPFSWGTSLEILSKKFVCVKAIPDENQAKLFALLPYEFIEPGFVILDADGKLQKKVDRITTIHPDWFNRLLDNDHEVVERNEFWQKFESGNYDVEIPLEAVGATAEEVIENSLLRGMVAFRKGQHAKAAQIWKDLAEAHPEHPLAWKAAAEAEGFGPFVRGFEVHTRLPDEVFLVGAKTPGSGVGSSVYAEVELWQRSVRFLLGMQREDGAWVDSDYDFGGTDSLPNVHVAVTSLAAMALLKAKSKLPEQADAIQAAIDKATAFVCDSKSINSGDRDEILWAHAYRTRLLARQVAEKPELKEKLQQAVSDLESIQSKRGSWYHEYANSFVTSTALCALFEASRAGAKVDQEKVKSGVTALAGDRFGNGAYPYSSGRGNRQGREGTARDVAASAGRMPVCELGLFYWANDEAEAKHERLKSAIEHSFDFHNNLNMALKYDDHTNNMAYGGFFFWYDMQGRCEALSQLQDDELKKEFQDQQRAIVLALPEIDGCFVDSHELGRCYGTAMALLCLDACEHSRK